METGDVLLIAAIVFVPAILLWVIYGSRQNRARRPSAILGIPQAMRPAPSDDVLEGPRLQRLQAWGLVATVATAAFIPIYWLPERERQEAFAERFEEHSVERGMLIFAPPPELEEDAEAIEFKAEEKALSLGQACANCHGTPETEETTEEQLEGVAGGGVANPVWRDPVTGETVAYTAPPLNNVFTRWDEEVVKFTIERGRPGTPMPAWGVEYGGSMTDMMVNDVMNWLRTLPGNQEPPAELSENCQDPAEDDVQCGQEIFEARCAVCHGPQGQGKEDDEVNKIPGTIDPETGGELEGPTWYSGMALWKGDVRHLPEFLHEQTIRNGRRFAFMPPFAEAPAQGIPVPTYPLTDAQIKAVMAYERTL